MFGRFLEFSVRTEDIAASVAFYERLGFTQLTTGDTWTHPYGVMSDGRACIGLHQYATGAVARAAAGAAATIGSHGQAARLSFVHADLAQHLRVLQAAGFEPTQTQLGEGDFHHLVLEDPAGQCIALLEARTFSPPRHDHVASLCGWFSGLSAPTPDLDSVQSFWQRAGFIALEAADDPLAQVALTSDTLTMTLHAPRAIAAPLLVFTDPLMPARLERLAALGIQGSKDLPRGLDRHSNALLAAPEGTLLLLLNSDS